MNKRRNIYRGINKKRNSAAKGITLGLVVVSVVGGIIFIKSSDFNLPEKISNLNFFDKTESKFKEFFSNDLMGKVNKNKDKDKDEDKIDNKDKAENKDNEKVDNKKSENKEKEAVVKSANSKIATVENWNAYSIQIAAIDNKDELKKIEGKLNELKIPFSILEIDNIKKVQTFLSFEEGESRKQLDSVKKEFSDAFISKLEVPMLSLEYTEKYSYVENICKDLNELINNFKEESSFWDKSNNDIDKERHKGIINNRLEILAKLENQTKKINYEGMKGFKENLNTYTKSIKDKSNESLKNAEKEQYYISKSLLMSSIQGYYGFVNSIKAI